MDEFGSSVLLLTTENVSLSVSPAVDRCVSASLSDARDAMTNAAIDSLTSYRQSVLTIQQPGLLVPACLRLFPLYILALLKQVGFFSPHDSVNSLGFCATTEFLSTSAYT